MRNGKKMSRSKVDHGEEVGKGDAATVVDNAADLGRETNKEFF